MMAFGVFHTIEMAATGIVFAPARTAEKAG
jgi:hypothetical protein